MKLSASVTDLTTVPEAYRASYVKEGDAFVLSDVEVPDVDGLRKSRDTILTEQKTLKERLAALDGVDADEYRKLKADHADRETKAAAAKGDFDTLKVQLVKNHSDELAAKDKQIARRDKFIHRTLAENEAIKAITEVGGRSVKALLPHVMERVDVQEHGDDWQARVMRNVDGKREVAYADGSGTPMTLKGLVEELKAQDDFSPLFDGGGSTGGGAPVKRAGDRTDERAPASKSQPRRVVVRSSEELLALENEIRKGEVVIVDG